jgi:NADH:ubiquinone oxidoreductase subunit E
VGKSNLLTEFSFSGELSKIIKKQDKIKYLQLAIDDRLYWIKVAKASRENLKLETGSQLKISGIKKQLKTGKVKFIATTIESIARLEAVTIDREVFKIKPKAKVLVCQKPNCWQRGGKEVCQQLNKICSAYNFDGSIDIKTTGCLGKCGQAPNIVMLPDKTRHSKIKPKQIPALIEKHLISQ